MSANAKKPRVVGVLAAFAALAVASCTAISGLSGLTFDGAGGGGTPCGQGDKCDPGIACRIGFCGDEGTCQVKDAPDGTTPTPENPCKLTGCSNGQPITKEAGEGAQCDVIDKHGVCVKGTCAVPCQADGDCATSDACTSGTCNKTSGKCAFDRLDGVPAPGVTQVQGDCKEKACKVGVTTEVVDDHDVAVGSACEKASCDNGTPKAIDAPPRSPCSTGGSLCDGKGNCVACVAASDCAPPPSPCQASTCNAFHCGTSNVTAGPSAALASQQISGDCHRVECDGNGGTQNAIDPSDPPDDGNPCTTDTCNAAGSPVHTALANGTPCGGSSTCTNGHCGCTTVADCPNNPNEACTNQICVCTPSSCAELGATCGSKADGCGNTIPCGDMTKDGSETDVDCGGPSCPACPQGGSCNTGSDCASNFCVDGVCCESDCSSGCTACSTALTGQANGLCRAIPAGMDPKNACSMQPLQTCGTTGNCDGMGACAFYPTTTVCNSVCGGGQATTYVCSAPNNCSVLGTTNCTPYRCQGGACKTSCLGDGDCANGHTCNINTGFCI